MPNETDGVIDETSSEDEIEQFIQYSEIIESRMVLFAHEYGHHLNLMSNPTYDEALQRCLRLTVCDRKVSDVAVVLKEEFEAWLKGFAELRAQGFKLNAQALKIASKSLLGYAYGILFAPPK